MDLNSKTLLTKLHDLVKDGGSLIFSIGDYYVQFAKDKESNEIYFEAVSHHYLEILPKTLKKEFTDLNFKINSGNYYKKVNTQSISSVVKDVEIIFKDIYKVNYEINFEISDDIEYAKNSHNSIIEVQTQNLNNQTQPNQLKVILIIGGIVLAAYWLFIGSNKEKIGDMKSEACIISEQFVARYLLAPKSAEFGFCDDYKIIHLGNNRYQVTNYVDASNAFWAALRKSYFIILKYNKGQWEDINNWTLEKIEIE